MMRIMILFLFLLPVCKVNAQSFDWVLDSQSYYGDRADGVSYDGAGNLYACGSFHHTLKIQSITLSGEPLGTEEGWVAKFNPGGVIQWALHFTGPGFQSVISMTVDRLTGEIYICGHFTDSITIGPFILTNHDFSDCFVARISTNGTVIWAYTIESELGSSIPLDIALDKKGKNVYIGIFADDSLDFTFGNSTGNVLCSPGGSCVVKYTNQGVYKWSEFVYTENHAVIQSIVVDNKGNLYASGGFEGAINWENWDSNMVSSVFSDAFLAKISSKGIVQWIDQVSGCSIENVVFLDADANNNIYMTGFFDHTVTIGAFELTPLQNPSNIFVTKVNSAHTYAWAKQIYSPTVLRLSGITADNTGNCYVLGKFLDTVFYSGQKLANATPGPTKEIFTIKFTSSGEAGWGKAVYSNNENQLYSWALDAFAEDLVAIAGSYQGIATFGEVTVSSGNTNDFYVGQLKNCPEITLTVISYATNLCAGDTIPIKLLYKPGYSYTWYSLESGEYSLGNTNQFAVDTAGAYYAIITSAAGCIYYSDTLTVTADGCSPKYQFLSSADEVKIYPLPASDELLVEIPGAMSAYKFDLFNQDGKCIIAYEIQPGECQLQFNVNELPPGIYRSRISSHLLSISDLAVVIQR